MTKKLTGNLNSRYFEASNYLRPGGKTKKRIVAYVESYDDVFFWRNVFQEFENDERQFEVMLPSKTDLSRGKKQAMTNRLGPNLGESMIACVDADLDYLMQGHTSFSKAMLENPYVIHTVVYAIENYQCYAPSLHEVCVMATLNDRKIFDFEEYLKTYSEIIYELFIWSVWLYRRQRYRDLPLNSFCNFIAVENLNLFKPITALEAVRKKVNRKVAWMQRNFPEAKGKLRPLKDELLQLGIRPDNTYLYIQGHHLFENVCMAALDPACTLLRREREKEIKRLAGDHRIQMDNELSSYQHSQCAVDQMLRRNTNYHDCEAYQKLRQQIIQFLELDKKSPLPTSPSGGESEK